MPRVNLGENPKDRFRIKLAERIRIMLRRNSKRQQDLANMLDVSPQGISYKLKKGAFSVEELKEIIDEFGTSEDILYIFGK